MTLLQEMMQVFQVLTDSQYKTSHLGDAAPGKLMHFKFEPLEVQ